MYPFQSFPIFSFLQNSYSEFSMKLFYSIYNLSSLSFQPKDPGIARLLWEVLACLSLFIPFSLWGAIGNGSPQSGQTMVVSRRRGWSLTNLPPSIPHFCLPLSCYCLREGWLGQVVSPLHPPNGLLLGARGKRGMELQGQDFS